VAGPGWVSATNSGRRLTLVIRQSPDSGGPLLAETRRPPRTLILALAAAAAIAVIFLTRSISGTDESDAGQILAAGAEQADPALLDGGWVQIDLPGTAQLRNVWDVEGILYAAGRIPQTGEAVLWRSGEGRDWLQIGASDGSFAGSSINSIVVFAGEVLALGTRALEASEGSQMIVPAVWRSATGEEFTLSQDPLSVDDVTASSGGGFLGAAVAEGRLVVVGWSGGSGTLDGEGAARGAVWISEDGSSFISVEDEHSFSSTGTVIRDVVRVGDSGLIAVGGSGGSAVVWQSANGDAWEIVSEGSGPADGGGAWSADLLVSGPNGVISYGVFRPDAAEALGDGSLYWSGSGEWERVDGAVFGGGIPSGVDADAVGYVAVGEQDIGDGESSGSAWVSRDGATWNQLTVEGLSGGVSSANAVAVSDDGVAIVGSAYAQPAIWFRPAGDLDQNQPVAAAGPLAPPAWATVFQEQTASDASPVSISSAGGRFYGFAAERVIWTSVDGREWSPALFDDVGLGDASAIISVVEAGDVSVAIGEADGSGLWVSTDGNQWGRPASKLPCCAEALFTDGSGFTALFAAGDAWVTAGSADGLIWAVVDENFDFPLDDLWESAALGPSWFVWGSEEGGEDIRMWESVDGGGWVEAKGPDGDFGAVAWEGVWQFQGQIVVAGTVGERTVVFTTVDGLTWTPVPLPDIDVTPTVRDAAPVREGLALLLVLDGRRLAVSQAVGGRLEELVLLSPSDGFGGLRAVLVPGADALRTVGPDHGRMTVWEWIP